MKTFHEMFGEISRDSIYANVTSGAFYIR